MFWRSVLDDLRRQLLSRSGIAPALLLAACGSSMVTDADTVNVTTDPSGDGSTIDDGDDESTTGSTGTSTGTEPDPSTSSTGPDPEETSDDEGEDLPKLDLPPSPDLPPLGDCTVTTTPTSTLDEHPECPIVIEDRICWGLYWGCVELEQEQTCESQCPEGNCVFDWSNCGGPDSPYEMPQEYCGPYEVDGQCCSLAKVFEYCGTDGRPFVVGDVAREAELLGRGEPSCLGLLPESVRKRLAAHWAAIARAEHASVASFAQFGARLLALGAPAKLVREALAAAADECRHAEAALAYASELDGRPLEFGPLDTREGNSSERFEATVLACVREGCIGETLAAVELRAAALACKHEALAATLHRIADDETRHAALAWRFVAWALDLAPSLGPEIAAQLDALVLAELDEEPFNPAERELLREHGCLLGAALAEVRRDGVRELIEPCAAALLDSCGYLVGPRRCYVPRA